MKKILFFILFLAAISAKAQYVPQNAFGYQWKYAKADSGLALPFRDTTNGRGVVRPGAVVCNIADSLIYYFNGVQWKPLYIDSSGIISILRGKIDSLTFSGNNLFFWANGSGTGIALNKVDSIESRSDSVFYYIGGAEYLGYVIPAGISKLGTSPFGLIKANDSTYIVDTIVIASRSRLTIDSAALIALINTKVNTSDTSTMLLHYFNVAGYGLTYSGQTVLSDTTKLIPYTDTLKVGGIATQGYVLSQANLSVKYTDTANMLLPYLRKVDTTGKWISPAAVAATYATISNLALKVNISDTASMLAPKLNKTDSTNSTTGYTTLYQNGLKASYTPTITTLENTVFNTNTVIVQDSLRGGTFNYVASATPDSGTVFNRYGGGYWQRQFTGLPYLKWYGTMNSRTLVNALKFTAGIKIQSPLTIDSVITIAQDKVIEIEKGGFITTSAGDSILIMGRLIAGPYTIFDTASIIHIRPYSAETLYPEWFGGRPLENLRADTLAFTGNDVNSTTAFKKLLTLPLSAYYGYRVFAATIKLNGMYGINDELQVNAGFNFVGNGQEFSGSGFRWVGYGDSSKSILHFLQASFSGISKIQFKGYNTTDTAKRLKSAIHMEFITGLNPTTLMHMDNINIGDVTGYWTNWVGTDFTNGILCDGASGENDFVTIDNLKIGTTDIGINKRTSMSVEWKIDNYFCNNAYTMFLSDKGGSIVGRRWYAEAIQSNVIQTTGGAGYQLRMDLMDLSSENMTAPVFIQNGLELKFSLSGESLISSSYTSPTGNFALITGDSAFVSASTYSFKNTVFNIADTMYVEQLGVGTMSKSITFDQCKYPASSLAFRFNSVLNNATTSTWNLKLIGENDGINYGAQTDKTIIVTEKNPNVSTPINGYRWLMISKLLNGETEIPATRVVFGTKGATTLSSLSDTLINIMTTGSFVNKIRSILPANSLITGVVLKTINNIMPSTYYSFTAGNSRNDGLFGTVLGNTNNAYNSQPITSFYTDTAQDLILKGWFSKSNNTYTLSGNTVTSLGAYMDSTMIGGVVRFTSGSLSGMDFTITGWTDSTHLTVTNTFGYSCSSSNAMVSYKITANKQIALYLTYHQVALYKSEINSLYNYNTSDTAVSGTITANPTQYVYNGVDTSAYKSKKDSVALSGYGTQYDISLKAPLASPALTGTPTAPTAAPGTNSTQLATTAYADAIKALKVNTSDTSTMLLHYFNVAGYGLTYSGQTVLSDTTKLIPYTDTLKVGGIATQSYVLTHSGGTPAGNYNDLQINRNSVFATPASDSLTFGSDGTLHSKGGYAVTGPGGTNQRLTIDGNGRIIDAMQIVTSAPSSITPMDDTVRIIRISNQSTGLTINNGSGTPVDWQYLTIRIKDNGTSQSLSWGSEYANGLFALPTSTHAGKEMVFTFKYSGLTSKYLYLAFNEF